MKMTLIHILILMIGFISCSSSVDSLDESTDKDPIVPEGDEVEITFSSDNSTHKISPSLIGFNCIYSHYGDDFWENTPIKSALKQMGTSFLRWPGGAPTNRYHWDNLNGQGWKDNWDPEYDVADDMPKRGYTDLDEYIELCRETGATPLVGINQGSGLKYNRVADALDEAKRLVQHCMNKGYDVNYYYLDNEPYHKGANYTMTWREYAEQIKLYAPAIKEINPDAKIVINWERVQDITLWNILKEAGEYVDVVEVHWYWKHGEATFETWSKELPMNSVNQWYDKGGSYKEEIEWFYAKCAELGYSHLKLGSFEWNVGPSARLAEFPTKYENTIMQAEMLMQFMDGGLEIANLWPIFWPKRANDKTYNPNRYLMDPTENYEFSPSLDMFTMLSDALGKNKYVVSSSNSSVYSLAVGADDKNSEMLVYALSKSDEGRWIKLNIPKYSNVTYEVLKPDDVDRNSGRKEEQPNSAVTYNVEKGCYSYYLPAYSLGYIKLTN